MIRQTQRDSLALQWLAEQYAAPLDLLQRLLGHDSLGSTRNVVTRWRSARWVELGAVDGGPSWVWPTTSMASALLGWQVKPYRPTPRLAEHTRQVARVRLHLCGSDLAGWTPERVLLNGVGYRPNEPRAHVADAVWQSPDGPVLVEVELSRKPSAMLDDVLSAMPHTCVQHGAVAARYFAPADVRRYIESRIAALCAKFPSTGEAVRRLVTVEELP